MEGPRRTGDRKSNNKGSWSPKVKEDLEVRLEALGGT